MCQELKEIIPRILLTNNPQLPQNTVQYNHKMKEFTELPSPGNLVIAYKTTGSYLHIETEEAKQQLLAQGIDRKDLILVSLMPKHYVP